MVSIGLLMLTMPKGIQEGSAMMNVSPMLKRLIDELPAMPPEFEIEFARSDRLDDMQLGYGRDVTGLDLSGQSSGDWQAEWLVFGYDFGDPVFVDTREEAKGFPVYVAEHGTGSWEPEAIAKSMTALMHILNLLKAGIEAGDLNYRLLVDKISHCTDNMAYWDIIIEGIEDNLA